MPRKNNTCGIYSITTPNGSVYVGSSSKIERRFCEHKSLLRNKKHHSTRLQHAFCKHGDSLVFAILCECEREELNRKEQDYIDKLNSKLNTTPFVNNVWTNHETREKLTKIHKSKKWSYDRSEIARNSPTRWRKVECSNGFLYKNLTDAAKAFGIRASGIAHLVKTHQIGKFGVKFKYADEEWKPETIAKDRAAITRAKNGYIKHSEATKAKMKKAKIGYKPSQKARTALIKKNSIPIIGISLKDGRVFNYCSTKEAAINHHKTSVRTAQAQICKCIHGRKKSAYGYRWQKKAA